MRCDKPLVLRLGGIYALERIARDSERDYWSIMEVLTAYIREQAPASAIASNDALSEGHMPRADIQAILTVIGRRTDEQRASDLGLINLKETDLRNANLIKAHLEKSDFLGANMKGAILFKAHLEEAELIEAHLEGAFFHSAHLEGAKFINAHLEGANLDHAHLEGAKILMSYFLGATFDGTHLVGAELDGAHLEGVDLTKAKGLTQEQIDDTFMDDDTTLSDLPGPDGVPLRLSSLRLSENALEEMKGNLEDLIRKTGRRFRSG